MQNKSSWLCKVLITIIIMIGLSKQNLQSQDLKVDIGKSMKKYETIERYSGQITTSLYTEHSDKPVGVKQVKVKKRGAHFLYELDGISTLFTNEFVITLNEKANLVACHKNAIGGTIHKTMLPDMKKMFEVFDEVQYKGIVDNQKCYVVKHKEGLVNLIEVYFDTDTYLITKMVNHYNADYQPEYTKVVLFMNNNFHSNTAHNNAKIKMEHYVIIDHNKVKLASKYKNYKLILGEGLSHIN